VYYRHEGSAPNARKNNRANYIVNTAANWTLYLEISKIYNDHR